MLFVQVCLIESYLKAQYDFILLFFGIYYLIVLAKMKCITSKFKENLRFNLLDVHDIYLLHTSVFIQILAFCNSLRIYDDSLFSMVPKGYVVLSKNSLYLHFYIFIFLRLLFFKLNYL